MTEETKKLDDIFIVLSDSESDSDQSEFSEKDFNIVLSASSLSSNSSSSSCSSSESGSSSSSSSNGNSTNTNSVISEVLVERENDDMCEQKETALTTKIKETTDSKEEEEKDVEPKKGEDEEKDVVGTTAMHHIYGDSDQEVVAWATHTLQRYYPGESFSASCSELRDGVTLIKLIECLMNEVMGWYYAEPERKKERRKNAGLVINYISRIRPDDFDTETICTARDIYHGEVDAIMRLVRFLRAKFDQDYIFFKGIEGDEKLTLAEIEDLTRVGIISQDLCGCTPAQPQKETQQQDGERMQQDEQKRAFEESLNASMALTRSIIFSQEPDVYSRTKRTKRKKKKARHSKEKEEEEKELEKGTTTPEGEQCDKGEEEEKKEEKEKERKKKKKKSSKHKKESKIKEEKNEEKEIKDGENEEEKEKEKAQETPTGTAESDDEKGGDEEKKKTKKNKGSKEKKSKTKTQDKETTGDEGSETPRKSPRKHKHQKNGEAETMEDESGGLPSLPELPAPPTQPSSQPAKQASETTPNKPQDAPVQPQQETSKEEVQQPFFRLKRGISTLKFKLSGDKTPQLSPKESPATPTLPPTQSPLQQQEKSEAPSEQTQERPLFSFKKRFSTLTLRKNKSMGINLQSPPQGVQVSEDSVTAATDEEKTKKEKEKEKEKEEEEEEEAARPEMTPERRQAIMAVFGRAIAINKSIKDNAIAKLSDTTNLSQIRAMRVVQQKVYMRYRSCKEMMDTEGSYLHFIQDFYDTVAVPLENTDEITEQDKAWMFGNLGEIIELSKKIYADLKEKFDTWDDEKTTIGDVLIKYSKELDIYKTYTSRHSAFISYIAYMRRVSTTLDNIFTAFEEKQNQTTRLQLDAVLAMPFQRAMRYSLLSNEIAKWTEEEHPDHALIAEAYAKTVQAANNINNNTNVEESVALINTINKANAMNIDPRITTIVREHHHTLLEAAASKIATKSNPAASAIKYSRPYFFVFSKEMVVCAERKKETYTVKEVIPLCKIDTIETRGDTLSFCMNDFICNVVFKNAKDPNIEGLTKVLSSFKCENNSIN